VVVVGCSTLATAVLVFLLSLQLRRREIQTLHKIGGSKRRVAAILASEVVVVAAAGIGLALVLTAVTSRFGSLFVRMFIT
jgi:putative ABC transport system permease protein